MTDFDKAMFDGKTIVSATLNCEHGADDNLIIKFDDGTHITIHAVSCNNDTGALIFSN